MKTIYELLWLHTKSMLKSVVTILTFLSCLNLTAQEQYIEIEVSDSIMSKIDVIDYLLMVSPEEEMQLQHFLKREAIVNKQVPHIGNEVFSQYKISFATWEEIGNFKDKIEKDSMIVYGIPLNSKQELDATEYNRLYQKLLKKSEKEAERIALAMNKEISQLIGVTYKSKNSTNSAWTSFPPLVLMKKASIELPKNRDFQVEKRRKLIMKYQVE